MGRGEIEAGKQKINAWKVTDGNKQDLEVNCAAKNRQGCDIAEDQVAFRRYNKHP